MRTGRRCGTAEAQRKEPARGRKRAFAGLAAALLAGGGVLMLGQSPTNPPGAAAKPVQVAANPTPSAELKALQPAAPQGGDAANSDGSRQLRLEADDLLRMANELMIQMDRTQKDTLSVAVVHKASAIEQLAHKMRDQ